MFKTKVHVFPSGRLGNQLYFGAMALAVQQELSSRGRKNRIIVHSENELTELNFLLGIKIDKTIKNQIYRRFLGSNSLTHSNIFLRAIYKIRTIRYEMFCEKFTKYEDISGNKFNSHILISDIEQDYRYFTLVKDLFINHQVHSGLIKLTAKYFSNGQLSNRIAVHMRFGDYLEPDIARQYGNLDRNYYFRALSALTNREDFEKLEIQLFSDDPGKGVELLNEIGITSVSTLEDLELPPEQELLFMSYFSRLVLSNSTFSWWAGYFASETSRVVAPDPLMRVAESDLSRSPNWIYIDGWS